MLKIALVLVKNVFFSLKKGISELLHGVAPKHAVIITIFKKCILLNLTLARILVFSLWKRIA